jgi:hypothetical protein
VRRRLGHHFRQDFIRQFLGPLVIGFGGLVIRLDHIGDEVGDFPLLHRWWAFSGKIL